MELENHDSGSLFVKDNLRGYWKLNTQAGPSGGYYYTPDSSGNGYSLLKYPPPTQISFVTGVYNNAVSIASGAVSLAALGTLGIEGDEAITMSIWSKFQYDLSNENAFFPLFKENSMSATNPEMIRQYLFYYKSFDFVTKEIVFARKYYYNDPPFSTLFEVKYTIDVNDGLFHNFIYTFDGSNLTGYVDGYAVGTTAVTPYIGWGTSLESDSFIRLMGSQYYSGEHDECILAKRAWTAQEVYMYYQQYSGALMSGWNF